MKTHIIMNSKLRDSYVLHSYLREIQEITLGMEKEIKLFPLPTPPEGTERLILFGFPIYSAPKDTVEAPKGVKEVILTNTFGEIPEGIRGVDATVRERDNCNLIQLFSIIGDELKELLGDEYKNLADMSKIIESYHTYKLGDYQDYILSKILTIDVLGFNLKSYICLDDFNTVYKVISSSLLTKMYSEVELDLSRAYSTVLSTKKGAVKLWVTYSNRNINELAHTMMREYQGNTVVLIGTQTRSPSSDMLSIRTRGVDAREVSEILDKYKGKEYVSNAFIPSVVTELGSNVKKVFEDYL